MEYYIKKQVTQVRIFQGHHDAVEKMFNRFMIENHFIEIIKIDTDTDNSYISKLERGNINVPIDVLQKIAEYFEVEVKDLFN